MDIQRMIAATKGWALQKALWLCNNNWDDAKDLLQDLMFEAWKNREQFKPDTNLDGWLFTMLTRIFIDHDRASKMKKRTPGPDMEWVVETYNDGETRLEVQYKRKEIERILTPMECKVVYLQAEGYSSEEISELTNLTNGHVRSVICKSRKKIKHLKTA